MNELTGALFFTASILLFLFGGAVFNHYVVDPLIKKLVRWDKQREGKHYR